MVAQNVFGATSYLGIPATILAEQLVQPLFLNRGTENDLMVLGAKRITGYEVVRPGGSGFIAPDDTRSPHYQDQLAQYTSFRYHRTWFTPGEVKAHLESVTVLSPLLPR